MHTHNVRMYLSVHTWTNEPVTAAKRLPIICNDPIAPEAYPVDTAVQAYIHETYNKHTYSQRMCTINIQTHTRIQACTHTVPHT